MGRVKSKYKIQKDKKSQKDKKWQKKIKQEKDKIHFDLKSPDKTNVVQFFATCVI